MSSRPRLACPDVIRETDDGLTLMGSRCDSCGEIAFPPQRACARCFGTVLQDCALGNRGTLWSWTIQGFLPKEPYDSGETEATFRPYGVGYVEMPSGVKVESRLTLADPQRLQIGMALELQLLAYRQLPGEEPVYTYAFAPAGAAA